MYRTHICMKCTLVFTLKILAGRILIAIINKNLIQVCKVLKLMLSFKFGEYKDIRLVHLHLEKFQIIPM